MVGAAVAIGMAAVAAVLVGLQLKLFREGDRRHRGGRARNDENPQQRALPDELKNPAFRMIWQNMDRTRSLMERRQAGEDEEKRAREKSRLKLPEEEEILFIGERSRLYYWPVALLSVVSLAVSSGIPSAAQGAASFALLAVGLMGLLVFTTLKSRARYYLTNFRVLELKRPMVGGRPEWSAIHYHQINRYFKNESRFFEGITIEGADESIEVVGLDPSGLVAVEAVLKERTADREVIEG